MGYTVGYALRRKVDLLKSTNHRTIASGPVIDARIKICNNCDQLLGNICKQVKCCDRLAEKISTKCGSCPIGKWNASPTAHPLYQTGTPPLGDKAPQSNVPPPDVH